MAKGHGKRYDHRVSRFAVTGCEGNVNTEKGRRFRITQFFFFKYIYFLDHAPRLSCPSIKVSSKNGSEVVYSLQSGWKGL